VRQDPVSNPADEIPPAKNSLDCCGTRIFKALLSLSDPDLQTFNDLALSDLDIAVTA